MTLLAYTALSHINFVARNLHIISQEILIFGKFCSKEKSLYLCLNTSKRHETYDNHAEIHVTLSVYHFYVT